MLHSGAGALYTAFKSSSHLQFIAFFHQFQFAERFQISSNNLSESNFLLPKIILNEGSSDCTKLQTKKKNLGNTATMWLKGHARSPSPTELGLPI